MLSNFVDRTNIRMIQCRRSPGLAPETLQRLRIVRQSIREKLQRNETTKLKVLGLVDHTHPTNPDPLEDAVMRNRLAKNGLRVRHRGIILAEGAGDGLLKVGRGLKESWRVPRPCVCVLCRHRAGILISYPSAIRSLLSSAAELLPDHSGSHKKSAQEFNFCTREVKSPAPSASLRASSVAKKGDKDGAPAGG